MNGIDPHDREFGIYHSSSEIDDAKLAETCLTYLSFQQNKSGGSVYTKPLLQSGKVYTLRQYGVQNWAEHARKNLSIPVISSLTQELLHPSKHHMFISWAQELRLIIHGELFKDPQNADLSTATPLHFACMLALPECCEWLLQKGCRVNQSSAFGTPLECALLGKAGLAGQESLHIPMEMPLSESGESRSTTVKLLLGSGADAHRSSLGQRSPLFIAVSMADLASCIELLRKGALIDSDTTEELSRSYRCNLAHEIWKAIDTSRLRPKDCTAFLNAALQSYEFCNDGSLAVLARRSQDILQPFLTAAEYGQLAIVEQVVQDHEFDINVVGRQHQRSALHLAASNDHIDVVKFLTEHGADRALVDSQGRTSLHTSVEKPYGCLCLEFLLGPQVDVNCGDTEGLTAWHLAALGGNIQALTILKGFAANGQLQLHLKTNDGRNLLHCAAQSSSKETLKYLMGHYNQDTVHGTTSDGFTALHYAVKANSLDAVQYLIDHEFDVHAITDDGSNTLHCAVEQDSTTLFEIVELLLRGVLIHARFARTA